MDMDNSVVIAEGVKDVVESLEKINSDRKKNKEKKELFYFIIQPK